MTRDELKKKMARAIGASRYLDDPLNVQLSPSELSAAAEAALATIETEGMAVVPPRAAAIPGSRPDQIASRHPNHLSQAQLRALDRASIEPRRIVISRQGTSAAVADSLVQLGLWSKFFESYPNTSRRLARYAFTDAGMTALKNASLALAGGDR